MAWNPFTEKVTTAAYTLIGALLTLVAKAQEKRIIVFLGVIKKRFSKAKRITELEINILKLTDDLDQLKQRVEINENRNRAILSISKNAYFINNKDNQLIYANTVWLHMTGLTMEQARGVGWIAAMLDKSEKERMKEISQDLRDNPADWDGVVFFKNIHSGEIYETQVRSAILMDYRGHQFETIGIIDIISITAKKIIK